MPEGFENKTALFLALVGMVATVYVTIFAQREADDEWGNAALVLALVSWFAAIVVGGAIVCKGLWLWLH